MASQIIASAPSVISLFDAGCAALASACAVYVAYRDSRWRKHGLAAQLSDRIDAAQRAADRWHETPPAQAMLSELDAHSAEISAHKVTVAGLATKADVEKLGITTANLATQLLHTSIGVDRIENILIKRALDGAHV